MRMNNKSPNLPPSPHIPLTRPLWFGSSKRFVTMSDNNHSYRRVSLDMSHGGPPQQPPPMNHPGNRSYGPQSSNGYRNNFGNNNMGGPIVPIPPVSCIPPRNGMNAAFRRQSAPGFYSRQDPLAPAVPSPHLPGMSYMPMQSPMHRRGSMGAGPSKVLDRSHSFNHPQHVATPPAPTAMQRQRAYMSSHHLSFDSPFPPPPPLPVDPFEGIQGPSDSLPGLDSTAEEDFGGTGESAMPVENETNDKQPDIATSEKAKLDMKKKPPRAQTIVSFPVKLYEILMDRKYSEFVTWLPHGRAWRILKQKSFEKEVIPKHFRSARYASFMRQVNGWGFKRITEGPDLNAYYHESFLRGLPELVSEMRRPQKGELPVRKSRGYPENPDFYKISSIAPLPSMSPFPDKKVPSAAETPSLNSSDSSLNGDELAVVSERSTRTKRSPTVADHDRKEKEETDAAAALFFGEVASVGSWVDGADEWNQRPLSPSPEHHKSLMEHQLHQSSSMPNIPRELKIPQNRFPGDSMRRQEDEVLSKADLAYLAQQNRLLLRQARMIGGVKQDA